MSIFFIKCSCFSGAAAMAERLERITARGARSSWEAAAINSFCFFWFSAMGFKDLPTRNQLTSIRAAIPAVLRNRNRIPWLYKREEAGSL